MLSLNKESQMSQVNQLIMDAEKTRRNIVLLTKKSELEKLKKEVELAEKELQNDEQNELMQWQYLNSQRDLIKEMDTCENHIIQISDLNDMIPNQKDELIKLQFLFESRQTHLIHELIEIYPIHKLNNTIGGDYIYTIRGLELNENIIQRGDENESAIGYLVHLLLLISKYLECPLRYQLLFYASRSMIRDAIAIPAVYGLPTTALSGVALPLHRRGVEKDRFDLAIQWLKCDVEQIMNCRRLNYDPKESMLSNMYYFFHPNS